MNKYTERVITLAEELTGWTDAAAYADTIDYIAEAEERSILNDINHEQLPPELDYVVAHRVLGALFRMHGKEIIGEGSKWAIHKLSSAAYQMKTDCSSWPRHYKRLAGRI